MTDSAHVIYVPRAGALSYCPLSEKAMETQLPACP